MVMPPEYGYDKPQRVCDDCFLSIGQISSEEKGIIDEMVNEIKEEILFSAFVIVDKSSNKKITKAQHIVIIGKYRLILFRNKKIALNLHFYDMNQVIINKDSVK